MSYTTERQPQGNLKTEETLLREGLIAEIVAINDYSHFIEQTDIKEVKDIFNHIMEEEKEHYGLFLEQLRRIDREQKEAQEKVAGEESISSKQKIKEHTTKNLKGNLLDNIRLAIKGELEAIALYDDLVEHLEDKEIIDVVRHVTREEKEHVEELTKALLILDKDSYGPISNKSGRKTYGTI
ncbi:ferritin-like domain-containing protein [Clostridium baratii]|uniref:ferritin-like domain-containing protein n=1 Tax=Clostridium baratii TaxID=1561 RepID=UPI0030CFFE30